MDTGSACVLCPVSLPWALSPGEQRCPMSMRSVLVVLWQPQSSWVHRWG